MKKHNNTNLLSLATLLMFLATAMPSFAQDEIVDSVASLLAAHPAKQPAVQPVLQKTTIGTEELECYVIASADDYETFRQIVATGNPYANAILTANITVKDAIGKGDIQFHYRGTFDGQGYTITMDNMENNTKNHPWGLFQYTEPGCVIRNLKVSGTISSGHESLGSIVGEARGTKIVNCVSDAKLTNVGYMGGLVGAGYGVNFIENCAFIGETYNSYDGEEYGIIGYVHNNVEIKSCYVDAKLGSRNNGKAKQFMKKTDDGQVFLNNYYYKRSNVTADQEGTTEINDADNISSGQLCLDLNINGRSGIVWYQHGDHPYPFKGEDGQLVTYDTSRNPVIGKTKCLTNNHVYIGNHEICDVCGALDPERKINPLQNSGDDHTQENNAIFVNNLRYTLNSDGTATVKGTHKNSATDNVSAVHIPETIRYNQKDYTVTKIDNGSFTGSKMEYCYIPKTVMRIENDAFDKCSKLTYLHLADGPVGEQHSLWMGEDEDEWPDQELFYDSPLETIYIGRNLMWDASVNNDAPFENRDNLHSIFWGPHVTRVGNHRYGNDPRNGSNCELFAECDNISKIYFMGDESSSMEQMDVRVFICEGLKKATDFYINRNFFINYHPEQGYADEHTEPYTIPSDKGLFYSCKNATYGPFVNYMSNRTFAGSKTLCSIDFSNAFNLTEIKPYVFLNCKSENFKELSIPTTVTTIAGNAFEESNIKCLTIEYAPTPLNVVGDKGITQLLDNIYLDREVVNMQGFIGVWIIGTHVETLRADEFADRSSRMFVMPSENPLKCEGGSTLLRVDNLFLDRQLVDANDPSNKEILFIQKSRSDLKLLAFGSNYTEIPARLFEGQTALKSLIIPENITTIGDEAFKGCTNLEVLSIMGEPTVGVSAFDNTDESDNLNGNLKYLFLMGNTIDLKAKAFVGNPSLKEVYTGFYEDPGASHQDAFDPTAYTNATLSCAGDRETGYGGVTLTSIPWIRWRTSGRQEAGLTTDIFVNASSQSLNSDSYDRARLAHEFKSGVFELIYLPFDMDSYYFGVDAEIYCLKPYTNGNNVFSDNTNGSTVYYDFSNIIFEKVNIDTEKTLKQGNTYLVKANHDDNAFSSYGSLFDKRAVSVNNEEKEVVGINSYAKLLEGGHVTALEATEDLVFVADNGVLKLVNGNYTPQQGRVIIMPDNVRPTGKVLNLTDEDNKPIMTSNVKLPFNHLFEGYSSFYAADYNYIAPKWCDVFIVTGAEEGNSITLAKIDDRTIPKGEAVLLCSTMSNTHIQNGEDFKEYLTYATHGSSCSYDGNLLKGVDEDTPANELSDEGFVYVLSCNSDYKNAGFYKLSGDRVMPAGKAYLDPSGLGAQALAKSCLFVLNDAANGIKTMQNAECGMQNEIYDIMGRRLQEAGFKGIYIVNGKKVVIK